MLEILERIASALLPSVIKSIGSRSRLKILCGYGQQVNADGVGNYLAFWVKIINPTMTPIYFERMEAIDQSGEVFFPKVSSIKHGDEIPPQRNIVGVVPCGHVTNKSRPKAIHIYDTTERKYVLNSRMLNKVITEIENERLRLENLGIEVHPSFSRRD